MSAATPAATSESTSRNNGSSTRQRASGNRSGPKTTAGKAAVRDNALSHGITSERALVLGESEEAWNAFHAGIEEGLRPVGGVEQELADRVALNFWRLRRVERYEAAQLTSDRGRIDADVATFQHVMAMNGGKLLRGWAGVSLGDITDYLEDARARVALVGELGSFDDDVPMSREDAMTILGGFAPHIDVERSNGHPQEEPLGRPDESALRSRLWLLAPIKTLRPIARSASATCAKKSWLSKTTWPNAQPSRRSCPPSAPCPPKSPLIGL